jgi:hypothetical protein
MRKSLIHFVIGALIMGPWAVFGSAEAESANPEWSGVETGWDRAMWVWRTREFLQTPGAFDELLGFSKGEGITDFFLQIVTERDGSGNYRLTSPELLASFIKEAAEAGIRVHALDGAANFALEGRHGSVLARVGAVLAYNESVAAVSQYKGVRMDVEPYTLNEWRVGGESRMAVMHQFLSMNRKVVNLIRSRAPLLSYGVDIPFWFDGLDEEGKPRFEIEFEGKRADLSVHLIRMVDNIGIMAYRNRATGPNSIFSLSQGELNAADCEGTTGVFIGVETKLPDGTGIPESITFGHLSRADLDVALREVEAAAASHPSFRGMAIHHYGLFRELTERSVVGSSN